MITYDVLFDRTMGHEGKLSLDPNDDGNWTGGEVGKGELRGSMYGISAAAYPHLDIARITREQAKAITYEDYYAPLGIERFCDAMKFQMLDAAYNHGMYNAVRMFQRAVKVKDDGIIGPKTLAAAKAMSESDKVYRFMAARIRFWVSCRTFDKHGKGWMNRAADNLDFAAIDNTD